MPPMATTIRRGDQQKRGVAFENLVFVKKCHASVLLFGALGAGGSRAIGFSLRTLPRMVW